MYSGSHDLRKHLKKIHPLISQHIKPNAPLTPQVISSINLLHKQQTENDGITKQTDINTRKPTTSILGKPRQTIETNIQRDIVLKGIANSSKTITPVVGNQNLATNLGNAIGSASTVMTVEPPLTIDFNDLKGYFTTSSFTASDKQPEQEVDCQIYKLP